MPDAGVAWRSLARASRYLAESLEYETTVLAVAEMALPYLGSWCIVDVIEGDGSIRRLGIVHPDPLKQAHAHRLQGGWPPSHDDPLGVPRVVRTRVSEIVPYVTDEMLVSVAGSEENLNDLRAMGIGSVVVVPLIARDHVLGAITFVSAEWGRPYTDSDVELAEALASQCALALQNARLYSEAGAARNEAEDARARAAAINERLVVSSIRQQELAEEAREANAAKSAFLATMSHEIRTPVNVIIGYADILQLEVSGSLNVKQRAYVDAVIASGRHLVGLIDDILDLAKVEAGKMQIKFEVLPGVEAIHAAVSLIESQAEVAGIRIETPPTASNSFYLGDGDRVRQILVILLSNALKFTERGGQVTVRHELCRERPAGVRLEGSGPWSCFTVADTGLGISPEDAATVFQPFFQVDSGNTRKRGGSGLGLAIALELARRMGGDLSMESRLGEGSCFTLWLRAPADSNGDGTVSPAEVRPV
jgi:signal transduction histidine kinase